MLQVTFESYHAYLRSLPFLSSEDHEGKPFRLLRQYSLRRRSLPPPTGAVRCDTRPIAQEEEREKQRKAQVKNETSVTPIATKRESLAAQDCLQRGVS